MIGRLLFGIAMAATGTCAAIAQTTYDRVYVASNGNTANTPGTTCSRTSPCASFSQAQNFVRAGGEILCLDRGDFGGFTITKELTIDCTATLDTNGSDVSRGGTIGVATGPTDRVTIRGFILHASFSNPGIEVTRVGVLTIDKVRIVGSYDSSFGNGVLFQPINAGAKLVVNDSIIVHAGNSSGGAGIRIYPRSGGTAQVSLNRVSISGSTFGLALDGSGSTGGINATVVDSIFSANQNDGIVATTSAGGAPIGVNVSTSAMSNNGYGLRSIGSNVTVRVDNSRITGNGTALTALSGGALLTGGGNTVQANAVKGAFTGSYALE